MQRLIEEVYTFTTESIAQKVKVSEFPEYLLQHLSLLQKKGKTHVQKDAHFVHQQVVDILCTLDWYRDKKRLDFMSFEKKILGIETARDLHNFLLLRLVFMEVTNINICKLAGRLAYRS